MEKLLIKIPLLMGMWWCFCFCLQLRYPQIKDTGIYECQISSTPPRGYPVYLSVVGEFLAQREFPLSIAYPSIKF